MMLFIALSVLAVGCALNDCVPKWVSINAVSKMEVGPPQVLYRRNLQTTLRCCPGDRAVLNGYGKSPVIRIR